MCLKFINLLNDVVSTTEGGRGFDTSGKNMGTTESSGFKILKSIIDFTWDLFCIEFTFAGFTFTLGGVLIALVIIAVVVWLLTSQWGS